MKKIILTISASIFFLLYANAQINFGIKGGLNFSNVKFPGSPNNTTRLGFNAGLLLQVSIFKMFMLQPELLYSIKGHKFPATSFDGGGTLSLNYISVPVLVGFRPTKKITVLAGPEFNFLTTANSKFNGIDHDVSKIYRKFNMAVDIGVAYKIIAGLGAELFASLEQAAAAMRGPVRQFSPALDPALRDARLAAWRTALAAL